MRGAAHRGLFACIIGSISLMASTSLAVEAPPWIEPGDIPLGSDVQSVIPMLDDLHVESNPSTAGPRRGSVAMGIPLPVFAMRRGPGCQGRWLSIGPIAWICQDKVRPSSSPAIGPKAMTYQEVPDGLPFRYYFVGRGGSSGYSQLRSVDQSAPDQDLDAGFAVAIVEERRHNGALYGRTHRGLWIPMRDLAPVRPKTFHGEVITSGRLDVAWVLHDRARAYAKASTAAPTDRKLARYQLLRVLEEKAVGRDRFLHIDGGFWVVERDVRRPVLSAPPSEVNNGERWIDIELASQTLVAYEGTTPVYATMTSTGKGGQGTPFATPKGVHRIWVKLIGSTMDNLEDEEARSYYSIEDVPWVQFFSKGVGLHGAFWHDDFGRVRSHGCVNLAPIDGQWLFGWTSPRLPAGWTAVLPTDLERGTVVRVR